MLIAIFVYLTAVKTTLTLEPECSLFSYQERLLEKMIKLELNVQRMKEHLDETEKRVADKLQMLETNWKSVEEKNKEMRRTNDETMEAYKKQIQTMKDSFTTPEVVFFAKDLSVSTPGNGATLTFKTVLQNNGNGYDNTTGMFTAPFTGLYLFTAQICLGDSSKTHIFYSVVVDGQAVKRGLFEHTNAFCCYDTSVVTVVNAGARVWVVHQGGSSVYRQDETKYWNTFNGVLLRKT